MNSQARILDGRALSALIESGIKAQVQSLVASGKRPPGLGVVLVGDNPASKAYVARKEKIAGKLGFTSTEARLPENTSAEKLASAIREMNEDGSVDGILVQLPLPKHLDPDEAVNLIDPEKDADGLHIVNQGRLMRGQPGIRPCTPFGVMKLVDLALSGLDPKDPGLAYEGIPAANLAGKRAVVIGRSTLVGKPVALMLLERNATVTIAHSKTANLDEVVVGSDIVIAAAGVPGIVKGSWIRKGAIVIDVGINRTAQGTLTGDVAFDEVIGRAAAVTPVPGGVGPMTVAMLMWNTLGCRKRRG